NVNQTYMAMASGPKARNNNYAGPAPINYSSTNQSGIYGSNPYNKVVLTPNRSFDPRVMIASDPLSYNQLSVQAGQLGYESQEMAGIYGFAASQARASLG